MGIGTEIPGLWVRRLSQATPRGACDRKSRAVCQPPTDPEEKRGGR